MAPSLLLWSGCTWNICGLFDEPNYGLFDERKKAGWRALQLVLSTCEPSASRQRVPALVPFTTCPPLTGSCLLLLPLWCFPSFLLEALNTPHIYSTRDSVVTLERESEHSRINVVRAYYRYHQSWNGGEDNEDEDAGPRCAAGSIIQLAVPWSVQTLAVW